MERNLRTSEHNLKIKGWFEIKNDKGDVELVVHNDLLTKGARWLLSALTNSLAGDGYPANAAKFIHYGYGNIVVDPVVDFRLGTWTGSLGAITTVVKTSDALITMSLSYTTGGLPIYINELAIATTAANPANSINYANAVLDRAVLTSTYIIPPNTTKTITYYMEINVA